MTLNINSKPRGLWISGNWKMNHTKAETRAFFETLSKESSAALSASAIAEIKSQKRNSILFPSFLSLETARERSSTLGFPFSIGAQNVHGEKSGAFTGEISGAMLREIGLNWALVGHSERRQFFGETIESSGKRVQSLIAQGINVMFCIGETRAERESGKTLQVLKAQIGGALRSQDFESTGAKLLIAYEPVWAIGTGLTATPEQAEQAHAETRAFLAEKFSSAIAEKTPILYGGSVKPDNCADLMSQPNIDGALIGGASLKAQDFLKMLGV
jgi:triosephosphate isomerase